MGPKESTMTAMSVEEHSSVRQDLVGVRDDLRGLAGEVRVKIHLAGMEAKDAWSELQPKLADYERRIESVTRDVATELRKIGNDLKGELERLRARIG